MTRRMMSIVMATSLLSGAAVYAGTGLYMKCQAEPEQDAQTGKVSEPCGYEASVTFGGGMFYDQVMGYCRACKKFVCLRWKTGNTPAQLKERPEVEAPPRPKPLGEVWNSQTGEVLTIYACPACKGPFVEIKRPDELKRCPVCNKPHFAVDQSKPRMALD